MFSAVVEFPLIVKEKNLHALQERQREHVTIVQVTSRSHILSQVQEVVRSLLYDQGMQRKEDLPIREEGFSTQTIVQSCP